MRPEREVLKVGDLQGDHCNCKPLKAIPGPENTSEAELWHFWRRRESRGGQQAAVQILLGLGPAEARVCVDKGCSLPLPC